MGNDSSVSVGSDRRSSSAKRGASYPKPFLYQDQPSPLNPDWAHSKGVLPSPSVQTRTLSRSVLPKPVPPSPSVSEMSRHPVPDGSAAAAAAATATPTATPAAAAPSFITQVARGHTQQPDQQQQQQQLMMHPVAPPDGDKSLLLPPPRPEYANRGLLVLDLDETLVHSSFRPVALPDILLPVQLRDQLYHVYVKKRPWVHEFLAAVAERWEVCVFTASVPEYADPLVNKLDPTGTLVQHRLFRQHCTLTQGIYVKDLDRLNRPLNRVVIVDNSPTAYLYHPKNALPIVSWFDNPDDTELQHMLPALEELASAPDIYPVLDDFVAVLQSEAQGQY